MTTATLEKPATKKRNAKPETLPQPAVSSDAKGTTEPPAFSAANIAGHEACKSYVGAQAGIESAEKALQTAKENAANNRSLLLAKFSQLNQPDQDAYIAGAIRYRDGLIKSAPGPIKQAGDFIGYLKRIQHNLVKPDAKFTQTSMTELLTGKGTLPEKMQQLENRINREKPAPKAPAAKPDPIASAPVVTDTAPKKHQQTPELSDRDIAAFVDKLHKGQLPIALHYLIIRAQEVGEADLATMLKGVDERMTALAAKQG